jgi:hypothetical protein
MVPLERCCAAALGRTMPAPTMVGVTEPAYPDRLIDLEARAVRGWD